ncbi:hypothetical protein DEO72_LG3g1033 [Vigna unguiculata]|uniref:ADP-ribosyl cyclase/cyclic ADP-ribose hydrolase n=1 Tax=Vigna unguiculata TaxID=3917 RepID=A0A4D6LDD7_VIGUN|nr:hypothetical protein DEO72_LG3g1033 [Vigna unguiculata]
MEEVERWRKALTEMANLSGWDVRNKPQYEQIEEIVENIINILGPKISNLPRGDLVGMEARVEELLRLLCLGSVTDVRVVGISGMGGIGKTTLGRALYERICHQYDYHCFIDDVSKIYQDSSSLGLQKQLISQSLNEKNLEISNAFEGTCLVWSRLRNARALVVFDNVNEVEQLRMFTGNRDTLLRDCLGGGSRIIVVSRDEHILKTHGVDDVYRVQPLNEGHALQLFGKYAFKDNHTLWYYEMLADDVLSHAQGHPLAIKVIGSSLFGRNMSQWKSVLAKLKENKSKNIMDVLRISFDQLDEKEKEAFLDIACFYNDYDEIEVKEILNFRGFHPEDSIQVLFDKSLITKKDGRIYMHGLLVDLGRCIVREKSPKEPLKWSRLWTHEDLHNAMLKNEATENLEAIVVTTDSFWIHETRADGLSKIKHLKLLVIKDVRFSGSLSHLSNELGYLIWKSYPFECLPQSFEPHKLVELNLSSSSIQRLWKGTKLLPNLKFLDLSFSKKLVEMPDVAEALNLEGINLHGCIQLRNINPSIGLLRKLVFLFLVDCKSLATQQCKCLDASILLATNIQSIIPESEIPRWFNNQFVSMDNSIIIDPSPVTHDNNWIGVVCCAIFRLGNEYDVRFPNPTYLQFPRIPKFPVDLRKDPVIDQSDHMKLFYFRRQDFTRPCWVGSDTRKFISLKLRMEDIQIFHHDRLGYQKFVTVDVKKYGYRWVYEEDQQPNFTLMYGKNLTDLKRKFSVIEENR